jgi:uncharacterized protein (DUF433 family)
MSDERLVRAARWVIEEATAPVEIGERHSRHAYVLVPLQVLLTPERRDPTPYVSASPCMKWGEPAIAGRRLGALDMAERYWDLGEHVDAEILQPYELRRSDLLVACWYVATHGSRRWQRRWGGWVESVWDRTRYADADGPGKGWYSPEWSDVPLPPTKKQAQEAAADGRVARVEEYARSWEAGARRLPCPHRGNLPEDAPTAFPVPRPE